MLEGCPWNPGTPAENRIFDHHTSVGAATSAMVGVQQAATYSLRSRMTSSATDGISSIRSIPWPADHTFFHGFTPSGRCEYPTLCGLGRAAGSNPAAVMEAVNQLPGIPAISG